jgi:hypothetical protein
MTILLRVEVKPAHSATLLEVITRRRTLRSLRVTDASGRPHGFTDFDLIGVSRISRTSLAFGSARRVSEV